MYILDGGEGNRVKFKKLEDATKVANHVASQTGIILGIYEEKHFKEMLKESRK